MENPVAETLRRLASEAGFDVSKAFCSVTEMREGIRQLGALSEGAVLTEMQRLALCENVRMVILRTAAVPNARPSLIAQSRLRRWGFLRAASPDAADAHVAVLGWLGIEPPASLMEEPTE
jgi:hypothetical protein